MSAKVLRLCDYDRRSREPDAEQPRDPCDAVVIILPPEEERPKARRQDGRPL